MSSVEGLQIESHNFDHDDYVLIRVDIGKMPPHAANAYIKRLREETAICKMLDARNIRFDLVGVRDNGVSGVELKKEAATSGSNNVAIGHKAAQELTTGSQSAPVGKVDKFAKACGTKKKAPRGSKVETLPGGQDLGEINDMAYFRQSLMRGVRLRTGTKEKEQKQDTVVANRNELLKTNDWVDELKHDSFAEAMKLMDE